MAGSFKFNPITPTVNRKGEGLTEICVGEGYISLVVSELHDMISLLTVLMARLVNKTAKITRTPIEQNPPVAVLKSLSPLYPINCEMAKRSDARRKDCIFCVAL